MDGVVVLNADFNQINVISWKRVFTLIEKGKVEVVKSSNKIVKNYDGDKRFQIPLVVRLINFIKNVYSKNPSFSKKNVKIRDLNTCAYCGIKNKKMTIDHIIPLSSGGKNSWTNCITSCQKCNSKKGNKSLKDSGLKLNFQPYVPSIKKFIECKMIVSGYNINL